MNVSPKVLGFGHSAVDYVDYSERRYLVKMRDGHIKSVKDTHPRRALVDGWIFTWCVFTLHTRIGNDPDADVNKMVALVRAVP